MAYDYSQYTIDKNINPLTGGKNIYKDGAVQDYNAMLPLFQSGFDASQLKEHSPIPQNDASLPAYTASLPAYTPEIPTKLTESDFQTNLNELMAENKKIREQYLASLKPSQVETDLGTQIADIQAQIGKQEGAFKQGLQDISQKRISMPLITGQQAALGRQAQLDVQTLATQEKNLLTRLGLAQEARQSDQKILETGMSFIGQDMDLQMKMQERIAAEQDRVLQRAMNMSALQKQTLSQFADAFKSYAPEQMESFQAQIAQMASKAGIPIDLALATIKSAQDEYAFDQAVKTATAGKLDTSITEVGGRKVLVNNQTGETIRDLGSSDTGDGGLANQFGLPADDPIFFAVQGLPITDKKDTIKRYVDIKQRSGQDAANKFVDTIAIKSLTATQKEDYGVYADGIRIINGVLGDTEAFKNSNLNLYKTALEKAKPLIALQKDQKWVDVVSKIEAAQARIRKGFFGTALTGTEKVSADNFLINFDRDDIATAETKLENMATLARDIQTRLLNEQKGVFETGIISPQDKRQVPSVNKTAMLESVLSGQIEVSQPKQESGWLGSLWNKLFK